MPGAVPLLRVTVTPRPPGERQDLASGALRDAFDIDVLERIVTQALVAIAATLAACTAAALTAEATP